MIKPLFQNIVVAVNGSQSSIHAAMYGILMGKLYRSNVKFVYVVDTATVKRLTMSKFFIAEESSEFEHHLRYDGQKYLDYVMKLAASKNVKAECQLREGSVWLEVVNAASEYKAGLILLGGNGRAEALENHNESSFGRGLFSSTDKEIICNSHCSVMVVHEPKIEQLFKLA